ncbi:MAG: hypothetical protein UZ17_ACD001000564 [Acidobacteria bacterium OLB17]|nr:MAG: hypothetical protein UZ17_ACD001000564 [Acidobacteria bacterium OLB17]
MFDLAICPHLCRDLPHRVRIADDLRDVVSGLHIFEFLFGVFAFEVGRMPLKAVNADRFCDGKRRKARKGRGLRAVCELLLVEGRRDKACPAVAHLERSDDQLDPFIVGRKKVERRFVVNEQINDLVEIKDAHQCACRRTLLEAAERSCIKARRTKDRDIARNGLVILCDERVNRFGRTT